MKNCNEMVNSLLERREEYETEKKKKRKMLTRTLTPICCVCLVALLGFGAWQVGIFEKNPPQTMQDAIEPGIKDWYGPGEDEPSLNQNNNSDYDTTSANDDTAKHLFAVNEIIETATSAPLFRDPESHYNKVWNIDKTIEYLGVNILQSVATLPKDLNLQYVENNEFTVTFKNDGTLVEDRICYNFKDDNEAELTVLVSKLKKPYDCIYISNTDKVTNIRITETNETIPLKVYAQSKSNSASDYKAYVIDFDYGGNYYRIIAENILPINLNNLVKEIVK